ncbi:MAG: hypothetical protein WCS42_24120 [Verrucomicrobiota bacterium]
MKTRKISSLFRIVATMLVAATIGLVPVSLFASGGSGSGGGSGSVKVDSIKVSKCYCNGSEMLIKASSSDPTAHLYAYRPDGTYQGEVQNGGGSRYGGTVMGFVPYDPGYMVISSSSGGSITVPTTPFQI